MDVASASLLEIPPQLAYVFSQLDGKTAHLHRFYLFVLLLLTCFIAFFKDLSFFF